MTNPSASESKQGEQQQTPSDNEEPATSTQKMYRGDLAGEEDTNI